MEQTEKNDLPEWQIKLMKFFAAEVAKNMASHMQKFQNGAATSNASTVPSYPQSDCVKKYLSPDQIDRAPLGLFSLAYKAGDFTKIVEEKSNGKSETRYRESSAMSVVFGEIVSLYERVDCVPVVKTKFGEPISFVLENEKGEVTHILWERGEGMPKPVVDVPNGWQLIPQQISADIVRLVAGKLPIDTQRLPSDEWLISFINGVILNLPKLQAFGDGVIRND